jgi:predicted outer membrane repeat protein
VIRFDCTTGVNVGAQILVNKDTVIDGHGVVFYGQGISRLFIVNNNARLTLLDVTIQRGAANDAGAGIRLDSGGLVAFDSTFLDNHGPATGGFAGGAIAAMPTTATIEIYGGRFSNNTSSQGGAIHGYAGVTIRNASFDNNSALGTGGGGAGGDGGALQVVGPADLELCGDTFVSNFAGNSGGAIVRIAQNANSVDLFTDVAIDFNRSNVGAGGAYLQGSKLTMRRVSATSNVGAAGGGLWLESLATLDAENLSIVANRADGGTGAGIFIGALTAGRIAFSTIADNLGNCPGCVQAAVANSAPVTFVGTIIVDNAAPTTPVACAESGTNAGANFQWPGDLPLCTTGATVTDPFLLPRVNATGPAGTFLVRKPSSGSPAIGAASSGCPAEDVLGRPPPMPCSAGSVEP